MPNELRHLRIVSGGTGEPSTIVTDSRSTASGRLIPTGVMDGDGNPYYKSEEDARSYSYSATTPPSGGGPTTELAGLQKNVGFLNWAAALLFAGGIAGFLTLDDRINDRIKPISDDIITLKVEAARQGALLDQVSKKIDSLDGKFGVEKTEINDKKPLKNRN